MILSVHIDHLVLHVCSHLAEQNTRARKLGEIGIGSKTNGATVPDDANDLEVEAAASSIKVDDSLTGIGADTIGKAGGYRRSYRRRNVSQKVDFDELNMHSGLRSLYGTRTNSDRRCPKDPCPCGTNVEDTEVGIDSDLSVAQTQKWPPTCEICGKVLPDWLRLKQHMNTHPGDEPIHCDVCGRGFSLLVHLKRHMKVHVTDRQFFCDICGASFAEKGHLDKHVIAHLPEDEKEAAMKLASAKSKQVIHRCRKCNETFPNQWRLRRHNIEKHRSRPAPTKTPESRCTCPICGKMLSYRLSVHMRQHTGERPYKCTTCGKTFYQRSSLTQHMTMHSGMKTHTCAQCGKSFRLRSLLRQHMRKHDGDLKHECPLCGKKFYVPGLLRDHLLLHTGERPFQCATCGRKFRLHKELGQHERRHLGEVADRCEVCGLQTESLNRHMLIHTGDKPHACEHCGKAFRRKEHLKVHCSRVHNVEFLKREKVQPISFDSALLNIQNKDVETINADYCGLTLVIGDSVVV